MDTTSRRLHAQSKRTPPMANAAATAAAPPAQDLSHLIRFIPAFRELDESDLQAIGKALQQQSLKAGEVFAKQGEIGHELFIVLEGDFQMYVRQEQLDFEK